MRKLKNILVLGLAILVLQQSHARVADAQELLVPPAGDASALGMPGFEMSGQGSGTREALPEFELPEIAPTDAVSSPTLEPIATPSVAQGIDSGFEIGSDGEDYRIFDYTPAALESTGTWLRRGFWYSELDILIMDRVWRRDNFVLAFQATGASTTGLDNTLIIEGGRTGAEATPRLNIGRFLFRDHKNRDHTIEFVAFGGGQWSTSGRLDATAGGTLTTGFDNIATGDLTGQITFLQPLDQGNVSFDGATSTEYEYDSRFNNFELNYHLKSRMQKDRMEMGPNGRWVRRAKPSISRSLLAGIRYFDLNEDFDWNAFGIDADNDPNTAAESGSYQVRTDNDLIGTQLGFSWTYETARWSLGLSNKSGMYWNHTDVDSNFEVTGGVTSGDNEISIDNLSFLVEGALVGKWHLAQNFSLRAGMEVLYVSSVAHAAEQLNFVPVQTAQTSIVNGNSTFLGGLIGFEGYW